MIYRRKIYEKLKEHLQKSQITVLTGMRRTGKTTLVKQLLAEIPSPNKIYLDLENVSNREIFFEKNYENVLLALEQRGLRRHEEMFVALDEIQLCPPAVSVLKYLYDHYHIKFIITGSSSYYLKNLFTESLAGRKTLFEIFPLDFGEFLTFKGVPSAGRDFRDTLFSAPEYERVRSYYDEFIRFGGFPEVVLETNEAHKRRILEDIISSYVNIDIATLADFRKDAQVYALIKMLASRVGTKLDYAKLSRLVGIANVTAQNYIDFFEKTYLITRVPVLSTKADREITKAKKVYFSDTGLANILADLSSGAQFENAVFTQLRHRGALQYYALKNGREIDFILDGSLALETKETPMEADKTALWGLAGQAGVPACRLIGRYPSPTFADFVWGGEIR